MYHILKGVGACGCFSLMDSPHQSRQTGTDSIQSPADPASCWYIWAYNEVISCFLPTDVISCFLSRPKATQWAGSCRALQPMTTLGWMRKAASQRARRRKRKRRRRKSCSTSLPTCLAEYPVGINSDASFIITHTHAGFKSMLDPFHTCTHTSFSAFLSLLFTSHSNYSTHSQIMYISPFIFSILPISTTPSLRSTAKLCTE